MDARTALCQAQSSQLVLIDTQERLAAAMPEPTRSAVVHAASLLLQGARHLDIPVLVTEQYPRGLGPTVPELAAHLPDTAPPVAKTAFSCCAADGFVPALEGSGRRQVVIAGMETHICVLQTAIELRARGYHVFVVEDAVCSRHAVHGANALRRLRDAGVIVTNSESVLFEWLRDSRHEHFKAISALIR